MVELIVFETNSSFLSCLLSLSLSLSHLQEVFQATVLEFLEPVPLSPLLFLPLGKQLQTAKYLTGKVKSLYCQYWLDVSFSSQYFPLDLFNNTDVHSPYQLNQVPLILS